MSTADALQRQTERQAGWLLLAFVVAVQIPFARLTAIFDYPDILRRPANEVLHAFNAGGDGLVLTWYAYAVSVLLFAAAVLRIGRSASGRGTLTAIGLASALLQGIALARWTFAVPWLARQHAVADPALQAAIEMQFSLLNLYLGVGLGEHLGQLLMVLWTLGLRQLQPPGRGLLKAMPLGAAALLGIGLVEQVATALGRDGSSLAPLSTAGFLLWSVWLLALGVQLARGRMHLWAEKNSA